MEFRKEDVETMFEWKRVSNICKDFRFGLDRLEEKTFIILFLMKKK